MGKSKAEVRYKRRSRRGARLGVPSLLATAALIASCTSGDPSDDGSEVPGTERPDGDSSVPVDEPTADETTSSTATSPAPEGWVDGAGSVVQFVDVTEDAGVSARFDSAAVVEADKNTRIMMGGTAAGDFDNDGDVDLFVLGGGNEVDSLFINDGDGNFSNLAESAGLAEPHLGSGVAAGDYDGDGDLDLFVTSHGVPGSPPVTGAHRLYRNNGDLTFTDVATEAGVTTTSTIIADGFSAVFGDIDLDGDLDLFVTGWHRDSKGNRLFENNGDGTFTDITDDAGIVDDGIRGFSPCLVDTTGDRYPELLLVADFGTSRYFVNNATTPLSYSEQTAGVGVGKEWSGMGTAVGDVDNDGLLDWYATAIFDVEGVGRGDGNKLYLGNTDATFTDVASLVGVDDGGWGWGAVIVDFNHDGRPDVFETNGWELPAYVGNPSRLWMSVGEPDPNSADRGLEFVEVASDAGPTHELSGLGVAHLDIDADGDQDLAVTSSNDEFKLFRNGLEGSATNWLRVLLDTTDAPGIAPNGVGSIVRVSTGDTTMTRPVGGCSSYNSTSELSAHVGIGTSEVVDQVRVEWADGSVTTIQDVPANQTLTVRPGD